MRASTRRRPAKHRGRLGPRPKRPPAARMDPVPDSGPLGDRGVTPEEFEDLVGQALDTIPTPLAAAMENVVVIVEDEPPPDQPGLLGLYEGIPLTARDGWYAGVLPDRITV